MQFVNRLLMGDAPWAFGLEVIWRAVAMYVLLLVFMRLMGKRVAAQLTIIETAVILMLGAAIGLPIQVLTQGILPAVVVLATTTLLHRTLLHWALRKERFETVIYGDVILLLSEGRMLLDNLSKSKISRELLSSELRAHGIQHLGELRRVYMETSGAFSIIPAQRPRPGLSLSPDHDDSFNEHLKAVDSFACWSCGHVVDAQHTSHAPCGYCGNGRWLPAVNKLLAEKYSEKH
jgi:uncharacterized membrane protein YcaP (DUF421 family)